MTLTPKTTIHTLLKEYPFLLEYLASYHEEFKMLTNPVARRTMGRLATLDKVAGTAGVTVDKLMSDIRDEVGRVTGEPPAIAGKAGLEDVDAVRQEELKAIVKELHAGKSPEELKERFALLIEDVEATEIAAMEQRLIAEGVPEDEVKRLCDVHVQVFAEALEGHEPVQAPAGHPVDTFQRENRALLQITASIRKVAERIGRPPVKEEWERLKPALAGAMDRLLEVDKHYLRKENQLFPFLERHGVEGPSKVMWALHDDIRGLLKQARGALASDDASLAVATAETLAKVADDMVYKEEKVLYPMAMDTLSAEEWQQIRRGEGEIGYALIGDVPRWPEEAEAATAAAAAAPGATAGGLLELTTGALTRDQLNMMLTALPVDLSYVDEHDEVRFYSEGERTFPRSPGVIGRKVQNCHPPTSVHKVQEILDAFRVGEKDVAEFWITLGGKFLHVRYFAVRGTDGTYRGTVEMVQDVTGIRALEGERRLLDW